MTYNNSMQSDFGKRYAPASAADARRYVSKRNLENAQNPTI